MSCCPGNVTVSTTEDNEREEDEAGKDPFDYPPLYKQPAFILFCIIIAFIAFFFLLFNYQEPDENLRALKKLKETLTGPFNTAKVTRRGTIEPEVHYFTETVVEKYGVKNLTNKKEIKKFVKKKIKDAKEMNMNQESDFSLQPPHVLDLENLLNIELELMDKEKGPVLLVNFKQINEHEVSH